MKQHLKEMALTFLVTLVVLAVFWGIFSCVGLILGYSMQREHDVQSDQCHKMPMTFEVEPGWAQHQYMVTFWAFSLTKMQCSGVIEIKGCEAVSQTTFELEKEKEKEKEGTNVNK